jgi:hypothetical protein
MMMDHDQYLQKEPYRGHPEQPLETPLLLADDVLVILHLADEPTDLTVALLEQEEQRLHSRRAASRCGEHRHAWTAADTLRGKNQPAARKLVLE